MTKPVARSTLILTAALLGNMIEYFDFTIYAIFAVAMGKVFFPLSSPDTQMLLSFSIFAVGFCTRPIGGLILGYIGTRFGRRKSLVISSGLMAASTAAIGLIPEHAEIGIASTYLLIVARLIQGICVSGEGTGVAIYVLEHLRHYSKGLITGIIHASNLAGTLLAAVVGIALLGDPYDCCCCSYVAWREAFIFGGAMSLLSMILRLAAPSVAAQIGTTAAIGPNTGFRVGFVDLISSSFRDYRIQMLLVMCTSGFASSVIYITKSYLNIMFGDKYENAIEGTTYTFYMSALIMVLMPFAGTLNDRFQTRKLIKWSAAAGIITVIPIFLLMNSTNPLWEGLSILLYAILSATIATTSYVFCISLFPMRKRFFTVSFAYNLGVAIFGGATPIISKWLTTLTHLSYAPAFYIMFTAGMLIVALQITKDIKIHQIEE